MPVNNGDMETRVQNLEGGLKALEMKVEKLTATLHEALLGTLEGKPGIVATLHTSLEASRTNSAKLDSLSSQVEAVRMETKLDKAKVTGIVLTVSFLWAALLAYLKYSK